MQVRSHKSSRTYELGEGTLRALPPVVSNIVPSKSHEVVLDWEGEVRCETSITSGGFHADLLVVRVSPMHEINFRPHLWWRMNYVVSS
jgi:hypothetical protein